jgi:hypothetical protein
MIAYEAHKFVRSLPDRTDMHCITQNSGCVILTTQLAPYPMCVNSPRNFLFPPHCVFHIYLINHGFLLCFCGAGDQTSGLMHAEQQRSYVRRYIPSKQNKTKTVLSILTWSVSLFCEPFYFIPLG